MGARRRRAGEFARIDRFTSFFELEPSPAGPGDDAAVLPGPPRGQQLVVTTDAVVEGVHFTRRGFSFEDVGHKALAVNLSDLAAMAATPAWFVCALAVPSDVNDTDLDGVARGMSRLARIHGIRLVGGNLTSALQLSITITAAGHARRPVRRDGARAGDRIYVSGPLGAAAGGLLALSQGFDGRSELVRAQRRPAPHLGWMAAAAPSLSAAVDVSDGLVQDVGHLARASGLRAELSSEEVPVHPLLAELAGDREKALALALTGGEDYVLAVTVPSRREATFVRHLEKAGYTAHPVGVMRAGSGVLVDGRAAPRNGGFTHFR